MPTHGAPPSLPPPPDAPARGAGPATLVLALSGGDPASRDPAASDLAAIAAATAGRYVRAGDCESVEWPDDAPAFAGRVRRLARDGRVVCAVDCVLRAVGLCALLPAHRAGTRLLVCLEGRGRAVAAGADGAGADGVLEAGGALAAGAPTGGGCAVACVFDRGQRVRLAAAYDAPPPSPPPVGASPDRPAAGEGADGSPAPLALPAPPAVRALAEGVLACLHCPAPEPARSLGFEARGLALLARHVAAAARPARAHPARRSPPRRLAPGDAARVREAAELLVALLDRPPSLVALARRVGMNDHKLKLGFRQVFGTTAFGYLRAARLERARTLLAGGASAGQAARAVGYSNASQFAAAYRAHFGVPPSADRARLTRVTRV